MLALLLACVHPPPPPANPGAPPRLPSPRSELYVHVEETSRDPLVAQYWPRTLDEGLSGAAAALGIALQGDGALPPGELRWRAILAGYPWPIRLASVAAVPQDEPPSELLALAEQHAATGDIGLIRSRDGTNDRWVLLVGDRRGNLPPFSREVAPGARLQFPGFAVRACTPSGQVEATTGSLHAGAAGEWLVELSDERGVVATFPVYAGRPTPEGAPFAGFASAEEAGDLDEEVLARLDGLDAWYAREPAERDPMLDALSRARLRKWTAGQALPPAPAQLAAAGFLDGVAGACTGATVADCLDAMWWSLDDRAPLAAAAGSVGWAATPTTAGVAIVVSAADRAQAMPMVP